jgi:hypothetical protein
MSGESVVYDEPADWIVEQARHQGATLSRRQLADWHRAELIPRPDRQFLGGPEGTKTMYPRGTLRQAIVCSALMVDFGNKDSVGWELWVRGYPVGERHWRGPLREAHEMFRRFWSEAVESPEADDDGLQVQSDAAEESIAHAADRREAPARLGMARRRLGRDGFMAFLGIAVSTAIGSFEVGEGSESESSIPVRVLGRLAGVEPAKHKAPIPEPPILKVVTGEAIAENLEAMAQFLPLIQSSISPDTITEPELASALSDLVFLRHAYLSVRQNEARIAPGSTPDLALLRQLFERLGPKEQAALLLIWLAVRNIPGWSENLDVLRQGVLAELRKRK